MKKSVIVYYRKLDRMNSQFSHHTLQDAIAISFKEVSMDWKLRSMEAKNAISHFINSFHDGGNNGLYGDLCAFSQSQMQAILKASPTGQQAVQINEMAPPNGDDFLLGMAHWLIIKDHVFLIQGPHLRARQIQEYFDWLLRECTKTIETESSMAWKAVFDPAEIGDIKDVSGIQVGGLVASNVTPEYETKAKTASISDWAAELFTQIFGERSYERLRLEMPNDTQISAKVTFQYKKLRRNIDVNMLQGLSGSLQDLPHSQVKVAGKNGTVSNNDARLHMTMAVKKKSINSVLLDPEDAQRVLKIVHDRFAEDEKID